MNQYAAIKRGAFISGLIGAATVVPNAVSATGALSPFPGGSLRRGSALAPRPYSPDALSAMRTLGIVSVTEAGYEYHSNGKITGPLFCNNPLTHTMECNCGSNGNCNPGDGNSEGYPVIGQVAVNYSTGSGSTDFSGAVFLGDFTPSGPHFGLPQVGFGPVYKFAVAVSNCTESHLATILGAMGAIAAAIQKYGTARFSTPLVQGLASAITRWGPVAGWTPGSAADFIVTVFADIASVELLQLFITAGLTAGVGSVLISVVDCIASLS